MKLVQSLSAILVIGTATVQAQPQPDPQPAIRVTSDTTEFCDHLSRYFARISAGHHTVPAASRALADEGGRLCAQGLIRAGISRLRMALYRLRPNR